jgi:hypothetical protein
MAFMTAGMGHREGATWVVFINEGRFEGNVGKFLDRQGVKIRAKGNDLVPRSATFQHGDDPVDTDTGADIIQAQRLEMIGDDLGRTGFTVRQLRVLVEIVPPCDHLFLDPVGKAVDLGVMIRNLDALAARLVFCGGGPGVHVNAASMFHLVDPVFSEISHLPAVRDDKNVCNGLPSVFRPEWLRKSGPPSGGSTDLATSTK